jgi:CRISPR type III-B/RAMP module RAMP protein Cmr6
VSGSPLPLRLAELLPAPSPGNPSLFFDRGMNRYDETQGWRIPAGQKEEFLQAFARAFNGRDKSEYGKFLDRRSEVLKHLKAGSFDRIAQTRLVIGLGLPNPLETGFLFDRLTGCPYLPGSSVKGLLRATARFVRDGEIEAEEELRAIDVERIFGPEIEPGKTARTGEAIFYDAFPIDWPALEVDVLTPHYKTYYGDKTGREVPADWDNPNPVAFLTVGAGTAFRFQIRAKKKDLEDLEKLLDLGLDWLGIGAKKSAGHGVFGKEKPIVHPPVAPPASTASPYRAKEPARKPDPPAPPPPPARELVWPDAELSLLQGAVIARKGKQTASCTRGDVERDLFSSLVKNRELRAEVEVLKIGEKSYRLVRVRSWRVPGK